MDSVLVKVVTRGDDGGVSDGRLTASLLDQRLNRGNFLFDCLLVSGKSVVNISPGRRRF